MFGRSEGAVNCGGTFGEKRIARRKLFRRSERGQWGIEHPSKRTTAHQITHESLGPLPADWVSKRRLSCRQGSSIHSQHNPASISVPVHSTQNCRPG